ncbi:MAG: ATP-dependent DNA ligase [Anaerolineae bacterium]
MRQFAELYTALDATTKTNEKIRHLAGYFRQADPADGAWAVYFLSGRRPRRAMSSRQLAEWARQLAGVPEWLFGECYDAVGDLAETITLLLPDPGDPPAAESLHWWVEETILPLQTMDEDQQRALITDVWNQLPTRQRFVWNKLITGGFRVGVSQKLVMRALAAISAVDRATVAHRMMGDWQPTPAFFSGLLAEETGDADLSRPYPFYLAYPLEDDPAALGPRENWQAEWKWDGIRAQVIRRQGQTFIWSRGEELVTDRYPEVTAAAAHLPDGTAIDGELLAWDAEVLHFSLLQKRIGRKNLTNKLLAEIPVALMAYDLIEHAGRDIRGEPLAARRAWLAETVAAAGSDRLLLSPLVGGSTWADLEAARQNSRAHNVEGIMLKRLESVYKVGRKRGDWWKWKVDPYTVDAVLIYAQRGSGRRAGLYTDYTFAVWDDDGELVTFAKAYSGLTDAEIREVDAFVRRSTQDRFGPVRAVTPELVFELAFEDLRPSNRHKSGIAVRFPRIVRWRRDKPIEEADSLATIRALLR